MKKKVNKKIDLNFNDVCSFFEGLDICIFLSLVNILASYYTKQLNFNLSLVLCSAIVLLSLSVRILVPTIVKQVIKYCSIKNLQFFLVIFGYGLLLILNNNFMVEISILLFAVSRIFTGISLGISSNHINYNQEESISIHSNLKFWFFFVIGIFLGLVFTQVLNDFFSNTSLSNGSWKWMLIFLMIVGTTKIFFEFKKNKKSLDVQYYFSNFKYRIDSHFLGKSMLNLIILIPFTILILFSIKFWLPASVLPENKQFSEILTINIIVLLMAMICSHFIFALISRSQSLLIVLYSGAILFLLMSLNTNNISSYSLSIMHFVLSIYSGMSLSLINLASIVKDTNQIYQSHAVLLFLIQFLIPFLIYLLLFNIIRYDLVYLISFLLYFISLLGYYFQKGSREK